MAEKNSSGTSGLTSFILTDIKQLVDRFYSTPDDTGVHPDEDWDMILSTGIRSRYDITG